MSTENLHTLAGLIRRERDTLLTQWRQEVRQLPVAHDLDVPTLNNHIPDLLEELAYELDDSSDESMIGELKKNPIIHGLDRLLIPVTVLTPATDGRKGSPTARLPGIIGKPHRRGKRACG